MICPDCTADLLPNASRCKCGWRLVAAPKAQEAPPKEAPRRPAFLDPPPPPTEAERRQAAATLAAIRALARRMLITHPNKAMRKPIPTTEAEKILNCVHEFGEPFSASRFGFSGHARRCKHCTTLDFVKLTPKGVTELAESQSERAAIQADS